MVREAMLAAGILEQKGIGAQVINARFIKPLDKKLILEKAINTGMVITVEENALSGGFGSAILELLEENGIHSVQIRRLGIPDKFIPAGPKNLLLEQMGLDFKGIIHAAQNLCALSLAPHDNDSSLIRN